MEEREKKLRTAEGARIQAGRRQGEQEEEDHITREEGDDDAVDGEKRDAPCDGGGDGEVKIFRGLDAEIASLAPFECCTE